MNTMNIIKNIKYMINNKNFNIFIMIFSPLEQFVIFSFIEWSNYTFVLISVLLIFYLLSKMNDILISNHIEWWYPNIKFIYNHLFLILTIWFFILFSNLLGMVPYNFTITAQFITVLSITIPVFIGLNLFGLSIHGFNLFYLILPAGVPLPLIPLISILELLSYFIRIVSLTLRLAANLLAGHILLKIILSTFISMPLFSISILPFIGLEFIVAILQAYVYTTLVLSYYQDVLLPH